MVIEKIKSNYCCFACNGTNLRTTLDLGVQPLANSYVTDVSVAEEVFPLKLQFCEDCTHLQLSHTVHPDYLFKHYLYVSGTSKTSMEYFNWFVDFTKEYVPAAENVLDIACNDGSQLDCYYDAGFKTFGIDPAENLLSISSKKSKVICDYLTQDNIKNFNVMFDIIIAQNVFAHNDYPDKFLLYCKEALSDDGCIFVQTSQANMIANNEFDTIYHEHLSFYSVKSFCAIAKRCGLNVIDIKRTALHGTSFVFVLSKTKADKSDFFINQEDEITVDVLDSYSKKCKEIADNLKSTINEYKSQGYTVIGYGAAAKGNTLLNFGQIDLDYIVDDNELKHNMFTPGRHIEIKHPDVLTQETGNIIIVPLAWNFYDEIKQKVQQRKSNVKFIKYFPTIVIE